MKKESIVVVGGGSIGKRHIRNLKEIGYTEIYCLKRQEDIDFEKEMGVRVFSDPKGLEQINPLAVFVCNPTSLHIDYLEEALRVNAHVFMEKPLIHSAGGLERARTLLKGYDKIFFIGFMMRYHPLVEEIKSILNKGQLGKVYSARFEFGSYLPYCHPDEEHRISYAARKELGGGVINTIEIPIILNLLLSTLKNLAKLSKPSPYLEPKKSDISAAAVPTKSLYCTSAFIFF